MTNVEELIEIATNLILKKGTEAEYILYPYATENLVGLFQNIDVSNKDCLTIMGSFDQGLDMALLGAKSVTAFDINPLTLPYAELKKSLILTGYRRNVYFEYLNGYYESTSNLTLNPIIFDNISKNLTQDAYIFWQAIFNRFDKQQISTGLFYDGLPYYEQEEFTNYMQKDNYQKLVQKLPLIDINLKECDILTLPNELNKTYDIIYFSNIISYPNPIYNNKSPREKLKVYKDLIRNYATFLKEDGKIISYIYDPNNNQGCDELPIFNKELREEIFFESAYSYIYFPAYFSETQDACLIYTKEKQ